MKNAIKFIFSIVLCELTGLLSASFTTTAIPSWYATLNKPFFNPPNWIFAPVWTLLYFFMGVAFYLIWRKTSKKKQVDQAMCCFLAQLALNFLWSLAFFGLKSPHLAFGNIILLWILILKTMKEFFPLSKTAFYLLIPYILWVSFAAILNFSILVLN